MKQITNFRNATVADMEGDGLLESISLLHVVSLKMANKEIVSIKGSNHKKIKAFLQWHIDNGVPVVFHNGICYDIPAFEKLLGMDLSELMVIDTLPLSWYLNTKRKQHGLASFLEDYGVEKPEVGEDEWKVPLRGDLSSKEYSIVLKEHQALMKHRCQEDVKINVFLWEDLKERLIDMYTTSKGLIDSGVVGGKRVSPEEITYLDQYRNTTSVDEWVDNILTFLMYKMDNVRIKEKTMWEVDLPKLTALHEDLDKKIVVAKATLESVMPKVPKYANKNFPKKPLKKAKVKKSDDLSGYYLNLEGEPLELSSSGEGWNDVIDNLNIINDLGHPLVRSNLGNPLKVDTSWKEGEGEGVRVKVLNKYEPPNAGSPDQIKAFLFSHGWKPTTFDFVDDKPAMDLWFSNGCRGKKPKPRSVPQISKVGEYGKELCQSVLDLADKVPEIMAYQKYTTIKHRRDMVKGWLASLIDGKYLQAGCGGFTNTLREQHRGAVNLPGVDKPYGEEIRGSLIAGKGKISLGSDLSALEDVVKQMFMVPYDPDYVDSMDVEGFCPHVDIAEVAKFLTKEQGDRYRSKKYINKEDKKEISAQRKRTKPVNYGGQYGQTAKGLSISAGIPLDQAKEIYDIYWQRNWSVKSIAEEQSTFKCSKGNTWLVSPINGFCYSLRSEKDRFSTLCQSTGSFFFDMWLDYIMEAMQSKFGVKRINGLFHDEYITSFKDTPPNRDTMEEITFKAIDKVNETFMLRRRLGCDVCFGDNYSQIH